MRSLEALNDGDLGERSGIMGWYGRCLIAGALIGISAGGACAQASAPEAACFEVLVGPSETKPAGAILLNRCNGQTWLLVRTYEASRGSLIYRWSAIATDPASPKATTSAPARPPIGPPSASTPAVTGDKCFVFQGRKFCE